MRKALFCTLFALLKGGKGLFICSATGSPTSPNTHDPISELSKKSEIGVMTNEKMAGKSQL